MKYKVFGCKVNKYYTNSRKEYFESKDNLILDDNKNCLFVSTCMVTDQAKNRRLKFIISNMAKFEKLFIAWCGSIIRWDKIDDSQFYKNYPELESFRNKITLLPEDPKSMSDIDNWKQNNNSKLKSEKTISKNLNTKKFLLIQTGCDNFCSFCMTVIARSKHKNIEIDDILDQINYFVKKWWKEIILTGVNLWAWWSTNTNNIWESKIHILLENILQKTQIPRIRISSLWPEFVSDNLIDILCNDRFLPYFHLSIQHFDDDILSNMKRHYDFLHLQKTIEKIKNMNKKQIEIVNIWADIITWFPWESDQKFDFLVKNVKNFGISQLHTFPFSWHTRWITVPASRLPDQILDHIRKNRNKQLHKIWIENKKKLIQKTIWQKVSVLIEKIEDGIWYGRTQNYIQYKRVWNFQKNDIIEIVFDFENQIL